MEITTQRDAENRFIATVNQGDGTGPTVAVTQSEPLANLFAAFVDTAKRIDATMKPEARDKQLIQSATETVKGVKDRYDQGLVYKRSYLEAKQSVLKPAASINTENASEYRQILRGKEHPAIMQMVNAGSLEMLAAVITGGQELVGFNDATWNMAVERYTMLNVIEKMGLMANYQMQPTLQDVLATGIDREAAESAGRQAIEDLEARGEIVTALESEIVSLVRFLANVLSISASDMLEMVLAA
jgi:hypothetical protein